jgi:crotonobetaine/carnitine-CoA ligase
MSGKWQLYIAAATGASLVLRESFSASNFWDDIRRFEVPALSTLGTVAGMLLAQPAREDDVDNPLEDIMMGPVIAEIETFKERFGVKRVATGYGMTELCFPIASGWELPNPRTAGRARTGEYGIEVRLADEFDEPVPVGTVGELLVRADPWLISPGYWRQPQATAEAWRNGWFHTGDAFRQDEDGWFYFVDRLKDNLRRRGENISSFDVEAGIRKHPAVAEVAVVGVPATVGDQDVKAVIVLRAGHQLVPEDLIEFLQPILPRFAIPRYVEFVAALPKTDATLRVQKFALRHHALNPNTWDRESHA